MDKTLKKTSRDVRAMEILVLSTAGTMFNRHSCGSFVISFHCPATLGLCFSKLTLLIIYDNTNITFFRVLFFYSVNKRATAWMLLIR